MTYPRTKNGYVDDGSLIRASNRQNKCPNCGSSNYRETVSREECNSCGLVCDYWGGGTNAVYDAYLSRHHAQQRAAEAERERKEREEWNLSRDDNYWYHDD